MCSSSVASLEYVAIMCHIPGFYNSWKIDTSDVSIILQYKFWIVSWIKATHRPMFRSFDALDYINQII